MRRVDRNRSFKTTKDTTERRVILIAVDVLNEADSWNSVVKSCTDHTACLN